MDIKEKLLTKTYRESTKSPNLYYYNFGYVTLFIDLRKDTEKHFFYQLLNNNNKLSDETKERLNKDIIKQYFLMNRFCKENFNFKLRFMQLYVKYGSGFKQECPICKSAILLDLGIVFEHIAKEFEENYDYSELVCSVRCLERMKIKEKEEEKAELSAKVRDIFETYKRRKEFQCKACNQLPKMYFEDGQLYFLEDRVKHHIDYSLENETVVFVCPSCHAKITWHLDKHPELKHLEPKGTRKEYLKRKRQEKLKRAEEKKIKKEERLKKIAEEKTKVPRNKKFTYYSSNINNLNKDWYKRK